MSVNVWYRTDENYVLSNLAWRPVQAWFLGQKLYFSVEHAYQSWKSGQFDSITYKKQWGDGKKFRGRRAKTEGNWNLNLMYKIMERSFIQNPRALEVLLATGDETITHRQGTGVWKVKFPLYLMKIRDKHGGTS